jgi:hypothetical protein
METFSLKALANKVLQSNSKGNSMETCPKEPGNYQRKSRIYSEHLQDYLMFVHTDEDMHSLRTQGITEAIYIRQEISELKKLPKEALQEVHKVKLVFPESTIVKVNLR